MQALCVALALCAVLQHATAAPVSSSPTPPALYSPAPESGRHNSSSSDPAFGSIAEALAGAPTSLSTLQAAVAAANLTSVLTSVAFKATVFAPTDAAFDTALASLQITKAELLADRTRLGTILSYHVVPDVAALSTQLTNGQKLPTLLGPEFALTVQKTATLVSIAGAQNTAAVVTPDIKAGQSVVHIIDAVLLPPASAFNLPAAASGRKLMMDKKVSA